jgi:hypothetical protein
MNSIGAVVTCPLQIHSHILMASSEAELELQARAMIDFGWAKNGPIYSFRTIEYVVYAQTLVSVTAQQARPDSPRLALITRTG